MSEDQRIAIAILQSRKTKSAGGIHDPRFPQQNAFVTDMSRLLCAQTTVRAGKTTGLAIKHFRAAHKYKRVMTPYIALTRDSAKNIFWPVLHDVADRYNIDCEFTEHDLTCHIRTTGSSIKLFGADAPNFMDRLKGIKTPLASVDECQSFRPHVRQLVEEILIARTAEYDDGQVVVAGTPGPVPNGFFYEASHGQGGFNVHKWSLFDNPYFPKAKQFVDELKTRKQWPENYPTLRREYYGEWVYDPDCLVFKYRESENHYDTLPTFYDWRYVIGVDFGFKDADAIAVVGWSDSSNSAFLIEEIVTAGQGITPLAHSLNALIHKYNPDLVVGDTGGLGLKIAEELQARYGIPIVAAEKSRKIEAIELLNDNLRTKQFFAKRDSRFAQDASRVRWDYDRSTPDKRVISDSFHSDACDATLYAFRAAYHWTYQPSATLPAYGTPERNRLEEDEMYKRARGEEDFKQQEEFEHILDMEPEERITYIANKFRRP
jgi:hypothetical protein